MKNEELKSKLKEKNAIVVHFSHHAIMRAGVYFPNDLINAISNKNIWRLSCCVVWPGHEMNLPGSVGVIFEPQVDNVVSVSNDDSGSGETTDGKELSAGKPLSYESFYETFSPSIGKYNEWRLLGAEVKGIFVADIHNICVKREKRFENCPEPLTSIACESVELSAICKSFTSLPVFTFCSNRLIEVCR